MSATVTPAAYSSNIFCKFGNKTLARAADEINDRYGEFTVVPATMANMQDVILKRVAFGSVGDL
jgi:hypothetical protein